MDEDVVLIGEFDDDVFRSATDVVYGEVADLIELRGDGPAESGVEGVDF